MKIGVVVLGLASIAAGILNLIWGEFESAHQPIQAFGDHIPGVTFFAYLAAIWLIAGGSAIVFDRTVGIGSPCLERGKAYGSIHARKEYFSIETGWGPQFSQHFF